MKAPTQSLETKAQAKINLVLRVLAREESGFHQIETIFARVSLADHLVLERTAHGVKLEVTGDVGGATGPANLVTRAAVAYLERAHADGGFAISLRKHIPVGAGLGGGSADAAATLRALDRLCGDRLGLDALRALAAGLGSDVPFLLEDTPVALGWGRGERLLPLDVVGSAWAVLALPSIQVDTGWAYQALSKGREPRITAGARYPSGPLDWPTLAKLAVNEFEALVYDRHPELADLRDHLARQAPLAARMSGTGAAHYALFEDPGHASRAAERLAGALPEVRVELVEVG